MTEFKRLIQQLPRGIKGKKLNRHTHQQRLYKYPVRLFIVGVCVLLGLSVSQAGARLSASEVSGYTALDYRSSIAAIVSASQSGDLKPVLATIELEPNTIISNESELTTRIKTKDSFILNESDPNNIANKIEGTVDLVPPRFELGQQLYLENCATCHVGVPPAVLPNQTWIDLIQDTQHYGIQIPPIFEPGQLIIWQYLEQFSRSLREGEQTPYRIRNSRFFSILHPRVEFNEPVRLSSCVSCHPGAPDFNYRRLTPEWQDSQ